MRALAVRLRRRSEVRAAALLAILLIGIAFTQPTVFESYDVVLKTLALTGLIAVGLTVVIVQGELDLSVGAVFALAGGLVATTSQSLLVGTLIALAVGAAVGVCNGLLVTRIGVNSFIATLSTMITIGGLAFVVTGGEPVPVDDVDGAISFGTPVIAELTPRVLLFAACALAVHVFLSRTRVGREFYAVGGNRTAAMQADVPVARRTVLAFVMCSTLAALAGATQAIELTSADPTSGSRVLLNGIAAAVIGGAHLLGGRGTVLGTTFGALALASLTVALQFADVSPNAQDIVVGTVLVLAVTVDRQGLQVFRLGELRRRIASASTSSST
jgi:ribose/xylose/arabinose/galactoside ABC-type transport system permease subunit